MKRIGIVGGGASGLVAAIAAARNGSKVVIFEQNDRVGKKILATGNGKCNLSNLAFSNSCYHSDNSKLVKTLFSDFGVEDTISFFEELGLQIKSKNGYLYPQSEQATAVLDILRIEMKRLGIEIITECKVNAIHERNSNKITYIIKNRETTYEFDAIIIATGSYASTQLGGNGSGYQIARKWKHTVKKPLPALVQIKCLESYCKSIAGVRCESSISCFADHILVAKEEGELQLTEYGLSGIPIFQMSGMIARLLDERKSVFVEVDFLPFLKEDELDTYVNNRVSKSKHKTLEEFLYGMVHKKIIQTMIKQLHYSTQDRVKEITVSDMIAIVKSLKHWKFKVIETNPFANAQICSGGVSLKEMSRSLESSYKKNVYFTGEVLDIDGRCGGYNLQWAWTSGIVAGINASREKE